MNEYLRDISLNLSEWEHFKTVEPFVIEKKWPVDGLRQNVYQKVFNGTTLSLGVFTYWGTPTHLAWGVKSEPHCSFHALVLPGGGWSEPIAGCPEYQIFYHENIISGFSLDGQMFTK